MKSLNLNHIVKVKLTDKGKDIFYHRHDEYNTHVSASGKGVIIPPSYPKEDENGYCAFQLYDLMKLYGPYMTIGTEDSGIQDLAIYIDEKHLQDVTITKED